MRFRPFEKGLVLCIDPGLRCCGVALFSPMGKVLRAGLPQSTIKANTGIRGAKAWAAMGREVSKWYFATPPPVGAEGLRLTRVCIEEQRIDSRTPNADDMLQVNGVAGACSVLFPDAEVTGYWPETWKGSIPKEDMTHRIICRMDESPEEKARVELAGVALSLQHNIYDGVGIGLYHFVRLEPKRVIHR